MYITKLTVKNIRNHRDFSVSFDQRVTLIAGENGSGKTSLLEAIIICLQGKSFRAADKSVIRTTTDWYRIDLDLVENTDQASSSMHHRIVRFTPEKLAGKKQFEIDQKISYRLLPANRYPVVLFEPDDLALLSGSPSRRRRFLDQFIGNMIPHYVTLITRYERALAQRNSLLKQSETSRDQLFAWDIALSDYGAAITSARSDVVIDLNERLSTVYQRISHTDDHITVTLKNDPKIKSSQTFLSELSKRHERDILLGYTSIGPHRDDMLVYFNDKPALTAASRGEVRSIVLALKIIEAETITETLGISPVILLDDVFSELDAKRQDQLIDTLDSYQIIITAATNHTRLKTSSIITLQL